MNPTYVDFLKELVVRLKTRSPKFFRILQLIFGAAAVITGIPSILVACHINLTGIWAALAIKDAAFGTFSAFLTSLLPVQSTTVASVVNGSVIPVTPGEIPLKQTDSVKMPFTAKAEINQTLNSPAKTDAAIVDPK